MKSGNKIQYVNDLEDSSLYAEQLCKIVALCEKIEATPDYNLLSYYESLNGLKIDEKTFYKFLNQVSVINRPAYISVKKLLFKTKQPVQSITKNEVFSTINIISNKLITDKEKNEAIDYLEANNIPLLRITYYLSINRILKNSITR